MAGEGGDAAARRRAWEERVSAEGRELPGPFQTVSSRPIERVYDESDIAARGIDAARDLGLPGEPPYTRGIHPTGYRGRPWTIRQFAGFGSAEETNARFLDLLAHGETGLSMAFDLPTLMGYDPDEAIAAGEFGKCGVGVSSLADMEILLDRVPLDEVTVSMTINGPAAAIWAMFIAAAERRGIPRAKLGGTLQNDILKEYIAQNEFIFPPRESMRLVTDTIEFATREMPRWNSISISGYHIREAGSSAAQELAFALANGFEYVRWALDRGLAIDEFAPRLSFFFNAHSDFFEEIAKYRAARRIWAREMRDTFGASNPRSWWMRFHAQTAGVSLTDVQPEVNLVRVALQALSAVLGGTQSLHTNAMDEALALPSEKAARLAVRTQQVLLHETGAANSVDPLGGSYMVESLTSDIEREAYEYFARIEDLGGMIPALEGGFPQREIAEAAYRFERELAEGERAIVGVTDFEVDEPLEIPILEFDPAGEARHLERLERVRATRDAAAARHALVQLAEACRDPRENVMPQLIDAANAYCTLGEITNTMRDALGEYEQPTFV